MYTNLCIWVVFVLFLNKLSLSLSLSLSYPYPILFTYILVGVILRVKRNTVNQTTISFLHRLATVFICVESWRTYMYIDKGWKFFVFLGYVSDPQEWETAIKKSCLFSVLSSLLSVHCYLFSVLRSLSALEWICTSKLPIYSSQNLCTGLF